MTALCTTTRSHFRLSGIAANFTAHYNQDDNSLRLRFLVTIFALTLFRESIGKCPRTRIESAIHAVMNSQRYSQISKSNRCFVVAIFDEAAQPVSCVTLCNPASAIVNQIPAVNENPKATSGLWRCIHFPPKFVLPNTSLT